MNDTVMSFDPNRFETAAGHYLAGRPPYSPLLIRRLAMLTGLDDTARVLDLGCGPGQLATGFAFHAGQVVAMDPEPEMLKIAASTAAIAPNVTFVRGSSYDLGPALGMFRLVVMGRSFHWMDRAATLTVLDGMIEPVGVIALIGDRHPPVPENAWRESFQALLGRYSDGDTERARRRDPSWLSHEAVLLASPFDRVERLGVVDRRRVSVEGLVERALSLSSTSRRRLGDKADELAEEVRRLVFAAATDGMVTEVVESGAIVARRSIKG